ncbi:MAG: NAD(P)H-dependent oxidoreductase [Thermoguttaceae bacterium]|nr:NAD(P)H-dependent oxidoreductase [Thermoguttaceae bacterium]
MKISVIVAHPNTGASFNHAITKTVSDTLSAQGHEVVLHDLYHEKFDPVLPAGEEKREENELPEPIRKAMNDVRHSDGLVFIHPNWWGAPPAILKGWLDRVLRAGFAYRFTQDGPLPQMTDKIVQVFSTSNTPKDVEETVYKNPIAHFWKTIVFGLCGCRSFEHRNFEPIILSSPEDRKHWLNEVSETMKRRFPAD